MSDHAWSVWPVLRPDSADYGPAEGYSVKLQQKERELEVLHRLESGRCLPAQWLREGHADLCCEVRLPAMLYSERFVVQERLTPPAAGPWEIRQLVELWPIPEPDGKPLYFLPAIVLREAREVRLDSAAHGVSALWHGKEVRFPRGAVLAGGQVYEDPETVEHLLQFCAVDLPEGQLRQRVEEREGNWRFVVEAQEALLTALQVRDQQHETWARALYLGCLAQMLDALRRDFRDPDRERPAAVERLGEMVREKSEEAGGRALEPPWETEEDNEDWGDTLWLASLLYPLRRPVVEEERA